MRKLKYENPAMFWELEGWLLDTQHTAEIGLAALEALGNADSHSRQLAVDRLRKARLAQERDRKAHVAKFAAATFANDAKRVQPPRAADKEILPTVDALVEALAEK